MSNVYSKRLCAGSTNVAGTVVIGTVPAGKVWVIKDLNISQTGTGSARAQVMLTQATGVLFYTGVLAQNDVAISTQRHLVLNAGETLTLTPRSTVAPFNLACQAHGYELDATI